MVIDHDLHIHTGLSLCADENVRVKDYVENAKTMGIKTLGITNHMWDENIRPCPLNNNRFYVSQTVKYNLEVKDDLEGLDLGNINILIGAEAEYHPVYGLALTEENAEKFDYIIAPNSHTHITMEKCNYYPYQKHADYMIEAYRKILNSKVSKHILAMAHPFDAVCCPYNNQILYNLITDDCFKDLFIQTAEKGIAIEINTACFPTLKENNIEEFAAMRMFKIAKEMGCKFTFGSDAHAKDQQYDYLRIAYAIGEYLSLKDENIVHDYIRK